MIELQASPRGDQGRAGRAGRLGNAAILAALVSVTFYHLVFASPAQQNDLTAVRRLTVEAPEELPSVTAAE